jgi:SAM-dependent methyltransferase
MSSLIEQKFGEAAVDYATSAVHARGPSLARVVELVAPQAGWRALDVATGAGHTAHTFAPHVAHVIASDITEEMLAQARSLAAAKALGNVETARANATALPFKNESFDLLTCRLAAHHFPDPAAFVGEAWRVLKPGGTLALVDNIGPDATTMPTASRAELRDMAIIYNAFEKLRDPSHGRCLALEEWLELLGDAGYVDVRCEILDQDIAFGPWTKRMRCDADTVSRLESMLGGEQLTAFLKPRVTGDGLMFSLKEAIIIARKAQRE